MLLHILSGNVLFPIVKQHPFVKHIKLHDPVIYLLLLRYGVPIVTKHQDPFLSLIESIISQQLSVKAASTIFKRFTELFSDATTILPADVITINDQLLRSVGLSWSKVSYVKHIASAVESGAIDFSQFDQLSDEAIIQQLTSIKGIGRWTAEMFLIFTLGRQDVFSVNDVGLKRSIQREYGLLTSPSLDQLAALQQNWKPYRSYVARLLWLALDTKD